MAKEECKAGAPEWMATYGDLVTLLMCFFVLLFAFSSIDAQKFSAVMQSFQGSAGILSGGKSLSDAPFVFDAMPSEQEINPELIESEKLKDLKEKIEEYAKENNLENVLSAEIEERGAVIRLKDNLVFDSGSAQIREEAISIIVMIAELLKSQEFSDREILIEGHTDNIPSNTVIYPSNWELSTARATSVVKYFLRDEKLLPSRISAAGYSEYRPIATNDTPQGRALNRRVDIVILRNAEEVVQNGGNQ